MNESEIEVGKTYQAKRPAYSLMGRNDRYVLWISQDRTRVQYDGPAVANGRHYPKIEMERFLKWAKCEVKEERDEE